MAKKDQRLPNTWKNEEDESTIKIWMVLVQAITCVVGKEKSGGRGNYW